MKDKSYSETDDGGSAAPPHASPFTLETVYGSVGSGGGPVDFDQLIRDAKDAKAKETILKILESKED